MTKQITITTKENKMKLYEITSELAQLEHLIDLPESEYNPDDLTDRLNNLKIDKQQKIEDICSFIKNLRAEAEAVKAESKKLAERAKRTTTHAEWLEKYLKENLEEREQYSSARHKLVWRKSVAVEIDPSEELDSKYLVEKIEYKPNKALIKEDINEGKKVTGAKLVKRLNLKVS